MLTSLLRQSSWLVISAETRQVKSLIFIGNIQFVSSRWRWWRMRDFILVRAWQYFIPAISGLDTGGDGDPPRLVLNKGGDRETEIMLVLISSLSITALSRSTNKRQYCLKLQGSSYSWEKFEIWMLNKALKIRIDPSRKHNLQPTPPNYTN